MKIFYRFFLLFLLLLLGSLNSDANKIVQIIPQPVKVIEHEGNYILPHTIGIFLKNSQSEILKSAQEFATKIAITTGYRVSLNENSKSNSSIHLLINSSFNKEIGNEGYQLSVNKNGIHISANKPAGLFYGLQTLLQIMPNEIESKTFIKKSTWTIPYVEITDYPRFEWRGMLFDVTRHFFTKQEVKDFIDNMVEFKVNRLHYILQTIKAGE
ncbi:MAG: beta-N-acetylhexosaminidase [Ginsengibacter sp.]